MKTIDGQIFKNMVISGSNNLYNSYPEVDALNVFPIPDGDTGTNMNLTMVSGVKAIQFNMSEDLSYIAKLLASAEIHASYGNSGSILAFYFKGISDSLKGRTEIDVKELSEILESAAKSTYKGVIQPVEGTMLTVIRESAQKLKESLTPKMSIEEAFSIYVKAANDSLERTPNLLPVLREVGVVDSGGAGFVKVIEGMESYLLGNMVERIQGTSLEEARPQVEHAVQAKFEEEEFGYCTEFVLHLESDNGKRAFNRARFVNYLSSHGNSLVVIDDEDFVKVHVHTLRPGVILNYAQEFGEFKRIKCENMTEQHHEILVNDESKNGEIDKSDLKTAPLIVKDTKKERKKYALIATSSGKGVDELFKSVGVDELVNGGQTNNPSAQDFIDAAEKVNAETVFIFPNNSNILMSARQAKEILVEKQDVVVVPTKTIMQGVVSAMNFNSELSKEENEETLTEAIGSVKSGAVTYSIKDTNLNNVHIKKGEFMAIRETKDIISSHKDKLDALFALLNSVIDEDSSVVTILMGDDVTKKEADKILKKFEKEFPLVELDLREGNQPVYSFLLGVE